MFFFFFCFVFEAVESRRSLVDSSKGVNICVPNIYKMSPELIAMVSTPSQGDLDQYPTSGTVPVHYDGNINMDPFSSAPTPSYGSTSALWEKLNGSNVSVGSVAEDVDGAYQRGTEVNGAEPPSAPIKRSKTMGVDYSSPPKMRPPSLKSGNRGVRPEHDEQNMESMSSRAADHRKRTVSGQVAHPPPPQPPSQSSSSSSLQQETHAPQRRSVRLFNQIKPTTSKSTSLGMKDGRELKKVRAAGTKGRPLPTSGVGRVASGNRNQANDGHEETKPLSSVHHMVQHVPPAKTVSAAEKPKEVEALGWLLGLFCKLSSAFYALGQYKCTEAIQILESLSPGQRETPWVLSQVGRAYYEQAMYSEAEKYFSQVKTLAPSQLENMEIYSTVLWHLKNEVEISYLAHELMAIDRLSPEAWCAVGNSFSIQRDHDGALKCFKRATQLDPSFAYGFTLQGHEYVANEEYDKALEAYRCGISTDNRHYNSWYGLGTVYDRMGKLEFAELHFRNAACINPTNAVLICCVGLLLEKMNDPRAALVQYRHACSLAPHSVLARFRKARALMKLQELRLALVELKMLKDMAPDEANVHYLLGKLYKMLRDKANAIKHFTSALNLDPKVCPLRQPFPDLLASALC